MPVNYRTCDPTVILRHQVTIAPYPQSKATHAPQLLSLLNCVRIVNHQEMALSL